MTEALEEIVEMINHSLNDYDWEEGLYSVGKPVGNTVPVTIKGVKYMLQLKKAVQ